MLQAGKPLLRAGTVKLFTAPQEVKSGYARALGWDRVSPPSQSGRYFSADAYGHLGYTGTSLWIDPERRLSVTLLTNRTWPHRESQQIKQVRPSFHDAVMQALGFV
jgi:CubicO group peptidase (beta-lactamase class C family)